MLTCYRNSIGSIIRRLFIVILIEPDEGCRLAAESLLLKNNIVTREPIKNSLCLILVAYLASLNAHSIFHNVYKFNARLRFFVQKYTRFSAYFGKLFLTSGVMECEVLRSH